jgi:hypothetical protein
MYLLPQEIVRIVVRFHVLAALYQYVFRNVAPYSLVKTDRSFRGLYRNEDGESTDETSVNFYQTAQCNIPEDR